MHSNSLKSKQTQASPYSRAFAGATLLPALLVTVLSSALLLGCGQGADAQVGQVISQSLPAESYQQRGETIEIPNQFAYVTKLFSMLQLLTNNRSRLFVLTQTGG